MMEPDPLASELLSLRFRMALMEARGQAFQDLFSALMERSRGTDFQRIRTWGKIGDRKNDGYVHSDRTIFACYGPNELAAAETEAKMESDFTGALEYWKADMGVWIFVHNSFQGLGPTTFAKLKELDKREEGVGVVAWGATQLVDEFNSLDQADKVALVGPVPSRRDLLDVGMAELAPVLDQLQQLPGLALDDLQPPPADKIERNLLGKDVANALQQGKAKSHLVSQYFQQVSTPTLRDSTAEAFRVKYDEFKAAGLAPDMIFHRLQVFAGGEAVPAVSKQAAVLAVLTYFFEECDIFEREAS